MSREFRSTIPGERAIILAEERREWWTGLGATAAIGGIAVAAWLVLSAPQTASSLSASVVPAADAATLLNPPRIALDDRIVPTAADTTTDLPLTLDDVIKVQNRLKALGFDPGNPDGKPGPRTMKALNAYRKSLGLQPVGDVNRQAVAPLIP